MLGKRNFGKFDCLVQTVPQLFNSLRNSLNSSSLLMKAAHDEKPNIFDKLLKFSQDLSIVDSRGCNVFHYVAGDLNDEWWLDGLKKHVNDNKKLKELLHQKTKNAGDTPLHYAVSGNKPNSIKWLLSNGSDIDATNKNGYRVDDLFSDAETKNLIRKYRDK